MPRKKVADPQAGSPSAEEVNIDPGLNSLLRGGRPAETPAAEATEASADFIPNLTQRTGLIQASLIGADLLLVGLAVVIVFKRTTPLGLGEVLLCFAAVSLGSWLSCLAVMLDTPPE